VYLIKPLGFVICASLVFAAIAYAFGSRSLLRDSVIGVLLALVAYGAFTYGLGLSLPPGPFKGLI
jgi:putative tricarboxylic transport membrane protein